MQMGPEGAAIKKAMEEAGDTCPPPEGQVVLVPQVNVVTHQDLVEVEKRITTKMVQK